jgi:putative SOS response-associated peptidase YedK
MCGRYGRRADKQRIAEWMQTHNTNVFDNSYFAPSYNVAPQSLQPVVRLDCETGRRELTVMRWGLVPLWILLANSFTSPTVRLEQAAKCGSPPAGFRSRNLPVAAD